MLFFQNMTFVSSDLIIGHRYRGFYNANEWVEIRRFVNLAIWAGVRGASSTKSRKGQYRKICEIKKWRGCCNYKNLTKKITREKWRKNKWIFNYLIKVESAAGLDGLDEELAVEAVFVSSTSIIVHAWDLSYSDTCKCVFNFSFNIFIQFNISFVFICRLKITICKESL